MRPKLLLGLSLALLAVAAACGSSGHSGFTGMDSGPPPVDASIDMGQRDAAPERINLVGDVTEASGCVNLQCAQTACAAKGKPETTLTGTIRDPAGNLPLYNVYVYVPNAPPEPITPGNPKCTPCEAPASGNPLIGTTTDTNGQFTLAKGMSDMYGVPSGMNIPLVIQIGKWRRQVVVPQIDPCTSVDLDTVLGPDKMRLPKMTSEGDMPLIALTTACFDAFECFLRVIGVDDSEFVPPGSPTGHVQIYTGACDSPSSPSSSIAGGNTVADTFAWWQDPNNLLKYDFVLNGCDGVPAGSRGAGYAAMETYLNGGGRTFATDFFVDWFSPPGAPADDATVASWPGWDMAHGGVAFAKYFIDTSFPKGMAYGQWLVTNKIAAMVGPNVQIALTDTWPDVNASGPPTYPDSTRWIYNAAAGGDPNYITSYVSFNAPIGTPTAMQCGRAVFSGVHVSVTNGNLLFPNECPKTPATVNQKALEFLFFDLSSCVQDDTQPPVVPPPIK
jgi:hypothetical protein